tara:strand:- start:369 stop:1094 length:726 start_codon:yes stop_codon:yes gene_type:complete
MDCLHTFQPWTLDHLGVLAACVLVAAIVIRYARTVRGTPAEVRVRLAWAGMTLLGEIGSTAIWYLPHRYDRQDSWPIHLCDLAAWITPLAMLGPWRWARTLLFFWGLGLSTQGLITPAVTSGVLDATWWVYWAQHLGVVGGAVYLASVDGYRPSRRDFAFIIAATLLLVFIMVGVNVSAGTNYMYVGNKLPEQRTVIHALGDWPGRVAWLCVLGTIAFSLVWAGSEACHRIGARRADPPGH